MPATAKLRYLRIAPRKVRLVANLIRGKSIEEAQEILRFTTKKAAAVLLKLLRSAIANTKNQFQLKQANLYISKITVDEGPKLKRWMPRARGQASAIQKKTSHVTLVLSEAVKELNKVKAKDKAKKEKPEKIEKSKEKISEPIKPTFKAKKDKKPKVAEHLFVSSPRSARAIEKGIKRIFKRKSF